MRTAGLRSGGLAVVLLLALARASALRPLAHAGRAGAIRACAVPAVNEKLASKVRASRQVRGSRKPRQQGKATPERELQKLSLIHI